MTWVVCLNPKTSEIVKEEKVQARLNGVEEPNPKVVNKVDEARLEEEVVLTASEVTVIGWNDMTEVVTTRLKEAEEASLKEAVVTMAFEVAVAMAFEMAVMSWDDMIEVVTARLKEVKSMARPGLAVMVREVQAIEVDVMVVHVLAVVVRLTVEEVMVRNS